MEENKEPKFYIYAPYYGAINQIPLLVKALLQEIPSADIVYNLGDFHDEAESSIERKISNLFKFHGLELERERLKGNCADRIQISFPIKGKELEMYNDYIQRIEIPIDPLKFEERVLLNEKEKGALRQKYKINAKEILCVGSMKARDVEDVYEVLKEKCRDDFQAILVPRYLSGINDFFRVIKDYDPDSHSSPEFKVRFSSEWKYFDNQDYNILMVDEVGLLADLYSISTIAYICDTHWEKGGTGQNPLEPAFYGVRIISGPSWECNAEAFEGLRDSGLLKIVESRRELVNAIKHPLTEEELKMYRKNTEDFIKSKQGYARYCAKKIKSRFGF